MSRVEIAQLDVLFANAVPLTVITMDAAHPFTYNRLLDVSRYFVIVTLTFCRYNDRGWLPDLRRRKRPCLVRLWCGV